MLPTLQHHSQTPPFALEPGFPGPGWLRVPVGLPGALLSPAVPPVHTEPDVLDNAASGPDCRWRLRAQKPSEGQHFARQEFVSKCLSPSSKGQKPRLWQQGCLLVTCYSTEHFFSSKAV